MTSISPGVDVVIPTVGRPSLAALLHSLARSVSSRTRIVVADDRRAGDGPLWGGLDDPRITVVRSGGRGPAAARNRGWRAASQEWVAFLDDDVDIPLAWVRQLDQDLLDAPPHVGAVTGRIQVPHSPHRRPTDWERNVVRLQQAGAVTADMAVRRTALEAVGGLDERFPYAYREDTDLVLRLEDAGWEITRGERVVWHRVRPAPWWVSVRLQRGNGADVLLDRIHGPAWRDRLGEPAGTYPSHRVTVAAAAAALAAAATRRPRLARMAGAVWLARTGRFAWTRIAPGPRTASEVFAMLATSAAIPPAACVHRLAGQLRWRLTLRGR
jgi:hypothetical protein